MSSVLKILDKKFPFIPTDKEANYLICKEYKEVFLGVLEIECHGNKLIAESVGDDVVKLDVEFDGKLYETYFHLKKGDEDAVIFSLKNLGDGKRIYKEEIETVNQIVEEEALPEPEPLVETYQVVEEAKVDIEQYKADAIKVINENFLNKKQKIEQLQESLTSLINGRLYQLDDITNDKVNNLRDDVLKSVNEALEVNKIDTGKALTEINAIKDDVATTAEFWSNILVNSSKEKAEQLESLKESVKFEVDTKIAELNAELKSQEEHITEAYDSIQKFIDKSKREFLEEKTSSFASVEALYEKVNKVVSENIKRAESLVGKKVTQLQSTADKKISDITSIVENKISLLDNRVKDIDESVKSAADSLIAKIDEGVSNIESKAKEHYFRIEEQTKNIDDIVNKNKNDFTTTVKELTESVEKKIKDFNLVAIKKEDLSQLKKQLETRLENESANLKKYVVGYAGGGSVAQQFAVGGTMNGTLNVASGQILSAGQDLFSLLGGGGGSGYQTLTYNSTAGELTITPNGNTVNISTISAFNTETIKFTPKAVAPDHTDGLLYYDSVERTLVFMDGDPVLTYPINKMLWIIGVNKTGSVIPKGTVVYLSGAQGNRGKMWPALATSDYRSADTIGITMGETAINQEGYIMTMGQLNGIDTSNYPEGTTLYLSPTAAGGLTTVKPQAPNHIVKVGFTLNSTNNGKIYVEIDNGYELDELHNVRINGVTNGQVLTYNSLSGLWVNATPTGGVSNNYLPLSGGTLTGPLSTSYDIEITDSTKGIILRSPSNLKYRVTVNDAGELVTTLV